MKPNLFSGAASVPAARSSIIIAKSPLKKFPKELN
jgi:hypothetical protein